MSTEESNPLGDELLDALEEHEKANEDFVPRTEYDGVSGYIQTGSLKSAPTSYDDLLRQFGYDPNDVQIFGHPRVSRWQQRAAVREWDPVRGHYRRTGEFETVWLEAYRFNLEPKRLNLDLPALYNEMQHGLAPRSRAWADGGSTVVVCWADIQTGKVDHLGGLKEQLQRLEDKRQALAEYLDNEVFDHIVIADVGDILEGFENTRQQTRTNSLSIMDQIDVAATEFWKTIRLCESYAPVDVISIPSNHCQWRKRKDLVGLPTDDWGLHISRRLERQADELGAEITFHRPSSDWDETLTFDIRGTKLGLAHGHQASNPDRVKDWWSKMNHAGVLDCDVLLTGHFHFFSMRPSGKRSDGVSKWHIQAPTLDNGSAWVRNKMGEDGDPGLAVFQINNNGFDLQSVAIL